MKIIIAWTRENDKLEERNKKWRAKCPILSESCKQLFKYDIVFFSWNKYEKMTLLWCLRMLSLIFQKRIKVPCKDLGCLWSNDCSEADIIKWKRGSFKNCVCAFSFVSGSYIHASLFMLFMRTFWFSCFLFLHTCSWSVPFSSYSNFSVQEIWAQISLHK